MEYHLLKIEKGIHIFSLVGNGRLKSQCGLEGIANYSVPNKFNIFHDEGDLADYITSIIFARKTEYSITHQKCN